MSGSSVPAWAAKRVASRRMRKVAFRIGLPVYTEHQFYLPSSLGGDKGPLLARDQRLELEAEVSPVPRQDCFHLRPDWASDPAI